MPTPIPGLNTKKRSSMLCLSGFEFCSRWVPLNVVLLKTTILHSMSVTVIVFFLLLFQPVQICVKC